ncbi:MAG: 50S ribosomal protein L11 methyltransferase [Pyrinomonadaceae bacterium]
MDNQKKWCAVEITIDSEAAEAVEFALNETGALGTEIDIPVEKKDSEILKVVGYFDEQPNDKILRRELGAALRIYNFSNDVIKKIERREVENKDWLAEWKKHWKATETAKFIIAPSWEKIETTEKIIIRIEPNMAFGTGTHETTRLCLKAIEENFSPRMSFFDVGTGTGILAVAAAKLQIPNSRFQIVGCDTDFDSIKIAEENAELNKTKKVEFYVGSIAAETPPFDFICANLTADVIVSILSLLTQKFNKILVLSGILKEQENLIIGELKKFGIENPQIEIDGDWIALQVKRQK